MTDRSPESVEKNEGDRGAAVRFPPPFVPVLALAAGLIVERLVGPLGVTPSGGGRYAIGAGFVLAGLACMGMAMRLFQATGQDPKPWKNSPELIAEGIYRWTRNPMYLGMGFLQAGLGWLFGSAWPLALVPVTWAIIYRIAIRYEEQYLEGEFGQSSLDYKASVRRWL